MTVFLPVDIGSRSVPYTEGLALQRREHDRVRAGGENVVILLEHEACYTAGRRTEPAERPFEGVPVIDVDRGGKITWHGPGQLVGYPIIRLADPLDVVQYVRQLEEVLMAVLDDLGVASHRVDGRSGVWVTTTGPDAKIAAIGIRVADHVTMHGFALNCSNSLDAYAEFVPCGISDAGVTTVSEVLGRMVEPAEVVPLVIARLNAVLLGTAAELVA